MKLQNAVCRHSRNGFELAESQQNTSERSVRTLHYTDAESWFGEFDQLFPCRVDSQDSGGLTCGFRVFEGESFEEFDEVAELFGGQMAGVAVLIAGCWW